MGKRVIRILIVIILIAIIGGGIYFFTHREKDYSNPDDAVGNTAGNLLNGGKFCEKDGYIYFANPYDTNTLWRMTSDCKKLKKIAYDSCSSINVYGDYIYFAKMNLTLRGSKDPGLVRISTKGKDRKDLSSYNITTINMQGNSIYMMASEDNKLNHLYVYDIKTKKTTKIHDQAVNPYCIANNLIYFSNLGSNHNVARLTLGNYQISPFLESNSYKALYAGQFTYYIDLDDNYSLVKVNNTTGDKTVLYQGSKDAKCISYNFTDKYMYYFTQGTESAILYRCDLSGGNTKEVLTGLFDGIYCTSRYTFITMYKSTDLYRIENSAAIPSAELVKLQ